MLFDIFYIVFQCFLSFDVAVGADGRPVLVREGGELQAVEGKEALAHVLLGVVTTSTLTKKSINVINNQPLNVITF